MLLALLIALLSCLAFAHADPFLPPDPAAHVVDLGAPGDEAVVRDGVSGREGPYPQSKLPFAQHATFRWATEQFAMKLPAYPGKRNAIELHIMLPNEPITVTIGDWSRKLYGGGVQHKLIVPAEVIGQQATIVVKFCATPRPAPAEEAREKRVLVAMVDWARVRPAREDEAMSTLEPFEPTPREIPVTARLRSVENRPAKADVESFVAQLKDGGANVVTISPTNGHVVANFPSKLAVHRPGMDPGWIPNVIKALREAQISVIFWMPFNVQDLRKVEDFAPAKQFPQWTMKFIADPTRPQRPQVGMCVQSSPYREHHARFIAECAAFDIDAMWFDGFYLGGIPHPTAPGCVCEFCAKRFKQATGLDLPKQVDWADMTFKRWVRWRNEDIVATMAYFRDAIHKVKPGLPVSANTNHWPFGNKDWDTAIPLWRITEFGVSEHAHSGKPEMQWLMLGFKSRLSHDTNPEHADIWRPAFPIFRSSGTPADNARHEHDMLLFMLSALSHGVVPWHGGQASPFEAEVRTHHAIAKREKFLSRNEIKHVAVWVSQDTHDFYGHIPGATNLVDYRDTVLGNWLVLSRAHVPFQFVFDNMITAGSLRDYKVLLAPNVAAMSAAAAEEVRKWVKDGGRLIFTAGTSAYDEWGNKLARPQLGQADGHYLPRDPGLAYLRDRDQKAVSGLLDAIRRIPPIEVNAPPYVLTNTFLSPDRKQLWVHLLNVSDYMPNDDTGFRGLESKPQFDGDGATDARVEFSDKPAKRTHKVARNIVITPRAWKLKSASLGVAGSALPVAPDGSVTVPELDVHDVVVLDFE